MANTGTVKTNLPEGFVLENHSDVNTPQNTGNQGNLPAGFQVENTSTPQRTIGGSAVPLAVGGAALGGAAALGYAAASPYRDMGPINSQLQQIAKQQIGEKVSTSDLPGLLTDKYKALTTKIAGPSLSALDGNITLQQKLLRNNRMSMDSNELNPLVDDISKHVASNYKPIIGSAYTQYRNSQNQIENIMEQSGSQFKPKDVNAFLNKTINDAIQQGVSEDKLGSIQKISKSLEDVDATSSIPFSQIKGNVGNLLETLPTKAQHVMASNWSDFMGQNMPESAQGIFKDMQTKYSKFAPMRNTLFDLIDTNKDALDTTKLSGRLRLLAKSGQNAGLTDLLGSLGNGTDITPPMEGLNGKVQNLTDFAIKRNGIASQLADLDIHRKSLSDGALQIDKQIQDAAEEHTALMQKTNTLLSQKGTIMEDNPLYPFKVPFAKTAVNMARGTIGKALGIGGKMALGLPFGMLQGELMNRSVGYNPEDAIGALMGNKNSQQIMEKAASDYAKSLAEKNAA